MNAKFHRNDDMSHESSYKNSKGQSQSEKNKQGARKRK